jgi:hypothetical protein
VTGALPGGAPVTVAWAKAGLAATTAQTAIDMAVIGIVLMEKTSLVTQRH